ncbi:hypothetical protein ABW19_dt0204813 [Dactylella cylindrospora]|nr:hypothetical protein ABW19_dt0204813 [Dactylella cylindrospora]
MGRKLEAEKYWRRRHHALWITFSEPVICGFIKLAVNLTCFRFQAAGGWAGLKIAFPFYKTLEIVEFAVLNLPNLYDLEVGFYLYNYGETDFTDFHPQDVEYQRKLRRLRLMFKKEYVSGNEDKMWAMKALAKALHGETETVKYLAMTSGDPAASSKTRGPWINEEKWGGKIRFYRVKELHVNTRTFRQYLDPWVAIPFEQVEILHLEVSDEYQFDHRPYLERLLLFPNLEILHARFCGRPQGTVVAWGPIFLSLPGELVRLRLVSLEKRHYSWQQFEAINFRVERLAGEPPALKLAT